MKKPIKKISSSFVLVFLLFGIGISNAAAADDAAQKFSQEEVVSLSRPSVVRIVDHVKGEAIFKPFSLDLDKMTINPGVAGEQSQKIPIDEYVTGSGFIVSQDGYIMTNSHVISLKEIKLEIIASVAQSAILDATMFSINADPENSDPKKFEEYGQRINDYLLREGVFNFEQNIVVLDPSSKKDKVIDLIGDGFPISITSVNENYDKDNMDVALIKIEQANLPALSLGDSSAIKTGEKIGVFGFPTTAELNDKNPLISTFSQGVVGAVRDSENKDFKIIQTDAKISEGSSGGPLLNESGQVLGMITYQTNKLDSSSGDNFAFAMPISTVLEGIKKFNISKSEIRLDPGTYNKSFSSGLMSLHASKCKAALLSFESAKNTNSKFSAGTNVDAYAKKCQDLISAGNSMDTKWDENRKMLVSLDNWVWLIVASVVLLFVAILIKLFTMKKRLKKDEKEIMILEEEIKENSMRDAEELNEIKKIEAELEDLKRKKI
jgi:S1-C subfamily serine protease